jgi:MFS transporter, YNFM family, putative membrane transport protein
MNADVHRPSDRRGLLGLGLAGLCSFLNVYTTQPILPLLRETLGVSKAEAALTVSAATIAIALAAPFVATLADRFGHRRVIVGSLFALVGPTFMAATASGIAALVAWRFAQGLAVPGIYAVAIAFAGVEWRERGVGRAMAALITGTVIGGWLGRAVSGLVADGFGWRASFLAMGVLSIAGAFATWRWLPAATHPPPRSRTALRAKAITGLVRDGRIGATLAVGFNVLFMQVAIFTYVTFYLADPPFGLGAGPLGWVFAVYLVGALVTPFAGRWIDRVGSRRVVAVALSVGIAGCALTLVPHLAAVVAGLILCCTSTFVNQSASTSHLSAAVAPELRSVASGIYLTCYYVGGAVGGVLPALAWHLGGWPACVFLVWAVQLGTLTLTQRFWQAGSGRRQMVPGTNP